MKGSVASEWPKSSKRAFSRRTVFFVPSWMTRSAFTCQIGGFDAFWQGSVVHEGDRRSDLRIAEGAILGNLDAYTLVDFSAGIGRGNWSLDAYVRNVKGFFSTRCAKFDPRLPLVLLTGLDDVDPLQLPVSMVCKSELARVPALIASTCCCQRSDTLLSAQAGTLATTDSSRATRVRWRRSDMVESPGKIRVCRTHPATTPM